MALENPCQEAAKSKPLFVTIYATVIVGIIFSSFYVFSAIYSSEPPDARISISTSPSSNYPSLFISHALILRFLLLIEVELIAVLNHV